MKIPLGDSIGLSFNNPTCVFDANRIAQYQNGTVTPPGNIKVVLTDVGGGCDVDSANALYSPMQNFWQHVTLSSDGKTPGKVSKDSVRRMAGRPATNRQLRIV